MYGAFAERLALVAGLAAFAALAVAWRRHDDRFRDVALYLTWASAAAATFALGWLTVAFLRADLSIEYVFLYTRVDYPWYYKLMGLWAAQKGTILLWTALLGILISLYILPLARRKQARPRDEAPARVAAWFFGLLLYLGFLWLTFGQDTFASTDPTLRELRPDGNGLNPILLSPYLLLHPPAEFIGYALTGILAMAALGFLVNGNPAWSRTVRTWTVVTWGVYTLGLGIGAMWAYYTLSFGGYWAWDPVEVSNLIPWIALTGFLHARAVHERHGRAAMLAPALAVASFALSLFATLVTRSGLWASVHAFTDPTGTYAKDPAQRLVNIMNVDPQIAAIAGLLGAFTCLSLALFTLRLAKDRPAYRKIVASVFFASAGAFAATPTTTIGIVFETASALTGGRTAIGMIALTTIAFLAPLLPYLLADDRAVHEGRRSLRTWFSTRNLTVLAAATLGFLTLATLLVTIQGVNSLNRAVFDAWSPYAALAIVLLLILALANGVVPLRIAVFGTLAILPLSIAATLALPEHRVLGLLIPAFLVALPLSLYRLFHLVAPPGNPVAVRATAALLLVAGLAGLLFWSNPPSRLPILNLQGGARLAAQAVGLAASAAQLVAALGLRFTVNRPRALVAILLSVPAFGYGVSLIAGALALNLALLRPTSSRASRPGAQARASTFRNFAQHVLHLALIVGLLGMSFSLYETDGPEDAVVLGLGESTQVGPYTLFFERSQSVFDAERGFQSRAEAIVRVYQGGQERGQLPVAFFWVDQVQHYDPETQILSTGFRDLYVSSQSVCRDPRGICARNDDWILAHENGIVPLQQQESLTAVVFQAKTLPAVNLVWTAFYSTIVGLVFLVWALSLDREPTLAPTHRATPTPSPRQPTATSSSPPPLASPGLTSPASGPRGDVSGDAGVASTVASALASD